MAEFLMLNLRFTLLFIFMMGVNNLAHSNSYEMPIISGVGGEFVAVNSDGETVKFSDYSGSVAVIAFGYTSCADICPFTLGYLKQLYKQLSPSEQKEVNIFFVTVDPDYDTPLHLKGFLTHFNEDFIGLSGTKEQTDYIVSLYQAEYNQLSSIGVPAHNIRRVHPKFFENDEDKKDDTANLFSHSVSIYLVDKDGFTRSIEYTGTPKEEFGDKIKQLINE